MAKRAATIDARRNLLERVLSLRLDSGTLVRDSITESDLMDAQTSGLVRDAYVTGGHFDGEIYTVNMELKLYNVYSFMKQKDR